MPTVRYGTAHPYHTPIGNPRGVARPLLGVRVIGEYASREVLALVDSGADSSVFHVDIAALAGIVVSSTCRRGQVRGVGGFVESYVCPVELEIEGRRFAAEVNFVDDPARRTLALLGRHDVFMQFQFGFDQRARQLLVEPYP